MSFFIVYCTFILRQHIAERASINRAAKSKSRGSFFFTTTPRSRRHIGCLAAKLRALSLAVLLEMKLIKAILVSTCLGIDNYRATSNYIYSRKLQATFERTPCASWRRIYREREIFSIPGAEMYVATLSRASRYRTCHLKGRKNRLSFNTFVRKVSRRLPREKRKGVMTHARDAPRRGLVPLLGKGSENIK